MLGSSPMDDASVHGGMGKVSWPVEQAILISKVENLASHVDNGDCMSRAVMLRKPTRSIYVLPAVGLHALGANDN